VGTRKRQGSSTWAGAQACGRPGDLIEGPVLAGAAVPEGGVGSLGRFRLCLPVRVPYRDRYNDQEAAEETTLSTGISPTRPRAAQQAQLDWNIFPHGPFSLIPFNFLAKRIVYYRK
jgi:hypothetical protein